ncbi:endonuclease/exonuclease/phosphatase family protein [Desulfocicer niacini]
MKEIKLFYISLFACTMSLMGCGLEIPHETTQRPFLTASYVLQSHFSMPGPAFVFDVGPDGRLMGISDNEALKETTPGSRVFYNMGALPGLKSSPFGALFFKVSPDGSQFAVGDGNGKIGIFNMTDLSGHWLTMPHFDAEWADNTRLAITHGEFGEPSQVSCVNVDHHKAKPEIIIGNIGGAPAGIAFDDQGNLFTGNGFKTAGPSGTGTIKYFPRSLWQSAMASRTSLDFETQGQVIVDILSASSLGFDDQGNLHVGGSDAFAEGKDINFAAIITRDALNNAMVSNSPIDPSNARAVQRLDPDTENATSRYGLQFNPVSHELYLSSNTTIYVCQAGNASDLKTSSAPAPHKQHISPKPALHPRFPGTIRLMTYNVGGNFMANARLDDAFARIFSHVSPDILILQEFTTTMAFLLPGRLESILGGTWYIFGGMKSGIYQTMIASRYPLTLTSQDTLPPSDIRGITGALVNLPREEFSADMYLMGFHLQCCDSKEFLAQRQRSADAAMAWIRDAKTMGGQICLPLQTPIIMAGDFNFVGEPGPENTFITGNIKNESLFGPDIKPDWDNSDLKDLHPEDPNTGKINTWPGSTKNPDIRYDRFYYTDSTLPSVRGFILNTLNFNDEQLIQAGVQKGDTVFASDHLPVVMEIRFP